MPPIEAELRRRDSLGDLQDWKLRDPLPADGGLHTDPVSDLTAHAKLQSAVDKLTDAVAALQGTLAVSGTVNIGTMPQVNVGTVEVTNDAGSPLPVSGTIALDAGSLAALETINAIVSGSVGVTGPVALDSATLTALENIVVSGSVALDAATLTALENIVVSGTVALDSATLSALETITAVVSGSVSVSNMIPAVETGLAKDTNLLALLAEFRNKYDVVQTATDTYTTSGNHDLIIPAAGQAIRSVWLYAQAKGALDTGTVLVTFTLGSNSYTFELTGSQPFAHGAVWEGSADQKLVVATSSTAAVIVNCDYRSFAP